MFWPMTTQQDASSHASTAVSETHKLQYIDILRGVAILGVIAVHSEQQIENTLPLVHAILNYGQMGVQLFFVASALTLCLSMSERHENSHFNFYVRRFFRIAPLYYLAIAFYFIWRILITHVDASAASPVVGYNILVIVENIFFLHGFDPRNFNFAVPGGWSISTEMWFYVIFPSLFLIQSRLGYTKFLRFSILVAALSLIAQFFLIDIIEPKLLAYRIIKTTYANAQFGFVYSTILNQISVFLIGILTFQKLKNHEVSGRHLLLAVLLCCVSCYLLNTSELKTDYNGFVYPILSSIAFSIIALKLSTIGHISSWPARLLTKIGQVSFSMYLLHFFVLDLILIAYKRSAFVLFNNPEIQLPLLFATLVVITYGAARLSYEYLEKPAINYGKKFIRR
jgi:peptidoglycan/LPS O-acetylase OafA/YrhL